MIGPTFDDVLSAAQSGAGWAYGVLYRELNPRLLRYFASQAPGVAEDLAAETWVGVARNLHRFSGDEGALRAWVFKIGHRRLADHWQASRKRVDSPAGLEALDELAGGADPEGDVVVKDSVLRALRLLRTHLSADQATVVTLKILGGLSTEQVAEVTGKRAGTVRVLQHKALKKLAGLEFTIEALTK